MADLAPPSLARRRAAAFADAESATLVDLSEVVAAPSLIVLVDIDALHPIERSTVMVLDALGHAQVRLVLYSSAPSTDVVKLRVELPRASWLHPSSTIPPTDLVAVMKQARADARVLAIGVVPALRHALDPARDVLVSLAGADLDAASRGYQRSVLCATLWAIVKLRYRVRETTAE